MMKMHSWSTRWTILLLLLVACFWGAASVWAGPQQKKTAMATHEILISGFKYQPDTVTVQVGDTVQWKNGDLVPHTVVAADGSFRSELIAPGAIWKMVPKKSGTFPYSCEPHPNMHGELIVQ
jgi:plastocyanin